VDLNFVRIQRQGALFGDVEMLRKAEDVRRRECRVASLANLTLVVSAVERDTLLREAPGARVDVLSNIHEVHSPVPPFVSRRDIMFIGGFNHPPNGDAVSYFLDAIWPAVRSEIPEARFFVVGDAPPDDEQWSREANVIVTGRVPDVAEYFDRCRVSVAPLRYGAGVKGKITQSLSYGVPVVATPVAVEGMHLIDGESVLVASDAGDFARAVVRLYTDERLWAKVSANGLDNVKQNFSVDAARSVLERILQKASPVSMSHKP
jgi:glycosyltransferase involved in cell wall biosynthesis